MSAVAGLQNDENLAHAISELQGVVALIIARHGKEAVEKFASMLKRRHYLCDLGVQEPHLTLEDKTYFILWDWTEDNILNVSAERSVSAERRLVHYVLMTLADYEEVRSNFGEDGSPARNNGNHPTSRDLFQVAEEVANKLECLAAEMEHLAAKVEHLAAVLDEHRQLRTNEQDESPARKSVKRLTSGELIHVAEGVADKVEYLAAVLDESQRLRTMNEQDLVMKTYHLLIRWEENQCESVSTRHRLASALVRIGKTAMADKLRHGMFSPVHGQLCQIPSQQLPYQDAVLFTGAEFVREEQVPLLASALTVGDEELSSLRSDYKGRTEGLVNALFHSWWATRDGQDLKEFIELVRTAHCLEAAKRFECE